jgi:hypothetical protein
VSDARTDDGHLVPLPGTGWSIWRDAVLRTTGFPAAGLDWFSAPECAEVADALLDGRAGADHFAAGYAAAVAEGTKTVQRIAGDPLFREAVAWQNPSLVPILAKLAAGAGPSGQRARQRRHIRQREDTVARYWQRYCGKNETIGFFGPVTWVTVDPAAAATRAVAGQALTRKRQVSFEYWALERFAVWLAQDPEIRRWLPVGVQPQLTVDLGLRHVLRPDGPPLALSDLDAEILARCDGRPAVAVAAEVARSAVPPRTEAQVERALAGLAGRGVLRWGLDLPYNSRAEGALRAGIAAIADAAARDRAAEAYGQLDAARAAVAAAAGDPDRLAGALAGLDSTFVTVTGSAPERMPGEAYAGRRLCFEDTVRDLDVTVGAPVLEALSGPMTVLLPAARWLAAAMTEAYAVAFREIYAEMIEPGERAVPLSRLWGPATRLLSSAAAPAAAVADEFTRRWAALFGLGRLPAGATRLAARSADLAAQAAEMFAAAGPAWAGARIHSPDLQICAASAEALARGEFTIVLGELHVAWPTLDTAIFSDLHPDPRRLEAAYAADIGPQFRPLYPTDWPRYTGRIAPVLGVQDHQLAFAAAPGGLPGRLLPIAAVTVTDRDGELAAVARDGRTWPLRELFALLVGWVASEAFRLTPGGGHAPRITVDDVVLARETWRTTLGEGGLALLTSRADLYLAARRWRRELGLPEKVFARVATEIKPVYVDFTSPRYISAFCTMLRSARKAAGDVPVVFTELLPGPGEAWVPDAEGRRYFSELRLQLRDPLPLVTLPALVISGGGPRPGPLRHQGHQQDAHSEEDPQGEGAADAGGQRGRVEMRLGDRGAAGDGHHGRDAKGPADLLHRVQQARHGARFLRPHTRKPHVGRRHEDQPEAKSEQEHRPEEPGQVTGAGRDLAQPHHPHNGEGSAEDHERPGAGPGEQPGCDPGGRHVSGRRRKEREPGQERAEP